MDEDINEKLSQLQHENSKLLDQLNHLKEHSLSVEENLNLINATVKNQDKYIKSLEQQIRHLNLTLKEKEEVFDGLEQNLRKTSYKNEKLSQENHSLKADLANEKVKNEQLEEYKTKEEDLRNLYAKAVEEMSSLKTELIIKCKEHSMCASQINDLMLKVRELEAEKAELIALKDNLIARERERRLKTPENIESYFNKRLEWGVSKPQIDFGQGDHELAVPFSKEISDANLREEILDVQVREKETRIQQLEGFLLEKEKKESERDNLIGELKEKLEVAGLLRCNSGTNFQLSSSTFIDIYTHLLKLINWPEGQSGECKPLTEVTSLAVVVKDGVQTTQPDSIRIVETISIASQTDPIKNLSPVLLLRTFEKINSTECQSPVDSDDEEQSLSVLGGSDVGKKFKMFSEHKNCDLDMDIYRSCRKLSVLPEEENDESFNKKSSFKHHNNLNSNVITLKTHSADDVSKFRNNKPVFKETTSCLNVITSSSAFDSGGYLLSYKNENNRKSAKTRHNDSTSEDKSPSNNELQLPIMTPQDAFRQPRSFDSYLDPGYSHSPGLARQISDPTQNAVFAPPITRRGSYIKKPRSTCRPLRLPCEKGDKKKEERICKVRFDLSGMVPKRIDNTVENSNPEPSTVDEKIRIVSRFKVEIVDEVEFRKSLEENNSMSRKRPPLIHSVVYKRSVFRDLANLGNENEVAFIEAPKLKNHSFESPDSPTYDTATEGSPAESFDVDFGSNYIPNDPYPVKRRKHSDSSCYSFEDSQDSSEGNDILIKSIKLHSNSECIIMKDIRRESSDSSQSTVDSSIPYIDAEDLPVIKTSNEIIRISPTALVLPPDDQSENSVVVSLSSPSDNSDAYLTPCEEAPIPEKNELSVSPPKSSGLSKSPTVLKNLANFELLTSITETTKKAAPIGIVEEEEEDLEEEKVCEDGRKEAGVEKEGSLKRTSSDVSEASESDTLTYGTVKSHFLPSSDGDSDTYVTLWSDRSSALERKFSDFSENSSSPYNTPPDTSSASFCTPPDTYSPILNLFKKHSGTSRDRSRRTSENSSLENKWEEIPDNAFNAFNTSSASPRYSSKLNLEHNAPFVVEGSSESRESKNNSKYDVIFDSPKLEFYETNDSVENLEAFLQTEEGLSDQSSNKTPKPGKLSHLESFKGSKSFELEEEYLEASSKRNSLESPKLSERRGKRHPPLSRQNSTEEYNYLEPHDSCLNLSEEMSSPSTTPDTSNKTVIFKNVPLTVSNTIDLEDEDFPISEAEIQVNLIGSQTEILNIPLTSVRGAGEGLHCRSEPCTPSMSSSTDFPEFSVLRKQRSSFTDESLICTKYESNPPVPPEIIVSNLSSDSDNSESEAVIFCDNDFASNVSDRSEVHLSDVNSLSGHSDNCGSLSDHSDNVVSDVFSSESDKSSGVSPEVSQNSSSSPQMSEKASPVQDLAEAELPSPGGDTSTEVVVNVSQPQATSGFTFNDVSSSSVEGTSVFTHEKSEIFGELLKIENINIRSINKNTFGTHLPSMSSDTPVAGSQKTGESSVQPSSISDEDSNSSKDLNRNSKKFTDNNRPDTAHESKLTQTFDFSTENLQKGNPKSIQSHRKIDRKEETNVIQEADESELNQTEYDLALDDLCSETDTKECIYSRKTSTPKSESSEPSLQCSIFPISVVGNDSDQESNSQTYLIAKTALKPSSSLSSEEIGKKFEDLSFAFHTDSMTINQRLPLLKRKRDQAESNVETELDIMKTKLKNLQYLGLNSDFINLMSDLKKQLEFVYNAMIQLSSSAEEYGYVQHEEKFLELGTVMLQHVENVESQKSEVSKILEKLKADMKRPRSNLSLENEEDDDKLLRRRSMAAMAIEGSRRRASIATLPRIGALGDGVGNGRGPPWSAVSRASGNLVKKFSFSAPCAPRASSNNISNGEFSRRGSIGSQHKADSRASESSMRDIDELPEQKSSLVTEVEPLEQVANSDVSDPQDSSLHLRQLFDTIEEIKDISVSQETVNVFYCLRRIISWSKLLLNATRFRWPDSVLHYLPFYVTWYVVFVLALVFIGGVFTGINGCYTYLRTLNSPFGLAAFAFFILTGRFYRIFIPLFLTLVLLLGLIFIFLTHFLFPVLTNEEIDEFFKSLRPFVEVKYLDGRPPI